MDKIIDVMIASLRARRLLAVKYSNNREIEMLNAQEELLKDIKVAFVQSAAKAKKKAAKKDSEKAPSKILVPKTRVTVR